MPDFSMGPEIPTLVLMVWEALLIIEQTLQHPNTGPKEPCVSSVYVVWPGQLTALTPYL